MSTLTFRAATPADIPALIALVTSAYRGDASRVGWTTEADLLDGARIDAEGIQADLDRPRSTILLAERGDQLVACAHVADVDGKGYFGMFSVDPGQQGGGVGKQLMDAAEAHAAREWNVPVMQMTVIDVRPSDEYAVAHLPFARSMPLAEVEQHLASLPRDKEIVAYCRGPFCLLSDEAVALLQARGFRARKVTDGVSEWQAAGLPLEREVD